VSDAVDDGPFGAASGPTDPEAETGMSDLFDPPKNSRTSSTPRRNASRSLLFGIPMFVEGGTALFMMTAWGRVDWDRPWLAICQISVVWVPMSIGATLGGLLPG